VGGSGAEIINHSCEPNLVGRIMKGHILYVSLRAVKRGEELTIDYNFEKDTGNNKCGCGTKSCRGTLQKLK
jgi:SET domain-containing protein